MRPFATALSVVAALAATLVTTATARAEDGVETPSRGQTVYVPIYSEIWHGNVGKSGKASNDYLSVLVSIRNTDPDNPIRVVAAPYYNTAGELIGNYVPTPRLVKPFGTLELFVEHKESAGGSGANFAVRWEAAAPVSPPIVEALHSRLEAGRSVAFVSRGKPVAGRQ